MFLNPVLASLDVRCAQTALALRIFFNIERNALVLVECLEAVGNDSGEMYEYILARSLVCDETESLVRVEPFYCTFAHYRYLHIIYYIPVQKQKSHIFVNHRVNNNLQKYVS